MRAGTPSLETYENLDFGCVLGFLSWGATDLLDVCCCDFLLKLVENSLINRSPDICGTSTDLTDGGVIRLSASSKLICSSYLSLYFTAVGTHSQANKPRSSYF